MPHYPRQPATAGYARCAGFLSMTGTMTAVNSPHNCQSLDIRINIQRRILIYVSV